MSQPPEFTRQVVAWTPWIETVDETDATPEQLAIVAEITGSRKTGRTYWAALARDADVLRHRHDLFPETLRDKAGEGGSPASDLELAAVAASRATGCVYCASKHAIEGMTKALAWELGPANIRVNTVCPTFIETAMTAPMLADQAFHEWVVSKIALGRVGQLHEVMGPMVFLASDASSLITGSALMLDGGWTAS